MVESFAEGDAAACKSLYPVHALVASLTCLLNGGWKREPSDKGQQATFSSLARGSRRDGFCGFFNFFWTWIPKNEAMC